jgi:hypothetical protein
MNRLILAVATATAACGAAVPAVLGLSGNPSFSQHIKVPVPSQAHLVQYDDRGQIVLDTSRAASPARASTSREPEPGDDHGGLRGSHEAQPGDDHGGLRTSHEAQPGDDHGGLRTSSEPEPGDDHGGLRTTSSEPEPGDDHGGRGGSDDPSTTTSSGSDDHGGGGHGGHGGDD